MANSATARVAASAALMDRASPGWARKVDLGKLNLRTADHCVVGQTFGTWTRGNKALDDVGAKAGDKSGFFVDGDGLLGFFDHRALKREWGAVVAERLVAA